MANNLTPTVVKQTTFSTEEISRRADPEWTKDRNYTPAYKFGRGKKEWGSRFTGYFDRLCEDSRAGVGDRECETSVLKAALALSVALQDGKITTAEIRAHRSDIEAARDALAGLLGKLTVAA